LILNFLFVPLYQLKHFKSKHIMRTLSNIEIRLLIDSLNVNFELIYDEDITTEEDEKSQIFTLNLIKKLISEFENELK
jgi:hypothetical protein